MAQLVARFHGMEEVRGSNPLSSTGKCLCGPVLYPAGRLPITSPDLAKESFCWAVVHSSQIDPQLRSELCNWFTYSMAVTAVLPLTD